MSSEQTIIFDSLVYGHSNSNTLNLSRLKATGRQIQSSLGGYGSGKVISRSSFHLGTIGCSCLIFFAQIERDVFLADIYRIVL